MSSYIFRRLLQSALILLAASFVVFCLVAWSGDPLRELRQSNAPNRDQLMADRSAKLHLDVPLVPRYFLWLRGVVGCVAPFAGTCDLGTNTGGLPVTSLLRAAIPSTLQLVTAATLLAIILGVTIGIVTALRQYSGFDYLITFGTFLFFSLPSFWVAVLLKEFGAIRFNDFLVDPTIPPGAIIGIGVVTGLLALLVASGSWLRRLAFLGGGIVVGAGVAFYLSASRWFLYPGLGIPLVAVFGVAIAFGATVLFAGLKNRKALWSSLISVGLGLVAMVVMVPLFERATFWLMVGLCALAVGASVLVGYLMGGYDRGQSMKAAGLTGFLVALLVALDRFFLAWPGYMSHPRVRGRPIATIGSSTAGLDGDFWTSGIDTFTHFVLPTAALVLISLASYTRYSRASMLEVMSQDYVRTARAKGLSERVVVTRHAFRNALIPIATIVAFDIGALLGGAVITERIFSIQGMGTLFIQGLSNIDPPPVMGFFLVTGLMAVVFNLLADLAYSALDPRVRVKA
ncbi:peptide/nickel transport system permease protein [Salana multivorans]|uniref:Peptide/nickel transport system permease protein n=1 Tax=Salana multivorans TaxID=120377 RepID=A0A3N2D7N7_9MICO|nr:ABC transporter permease subunit [Salana multivorans]MBN8881813.1 ABC transporter permease [Salana multivorans]OJX98376.1 MAG: ABC transporter permease [Micrococcales bacterium 73-15]ROR95799.1 peptide/nickel transport system permease protein [Salana multivorans]